MLGLYTLFVPLYHFVSQEEEVGHLRLHRVVYKAEAAMYYYDTI